MKLILRLLLALVLLLLLAAFALWLSGNSYLFKGVWATYLHGKNSATITDGRYFDQRRIAASQPQAWPVGSNYNQMELSERLRQSLEQTESIAFLVIKNDSIRYEEYWSEGSDSSRTNSFSMAKSITTMLVQRAIEDGYIGSWEDKVIDYLPQLEGPYRSDLRLKHLSTMTAGLQWNEHYTNPFDITARAYYSDNIEKVMLEKVPVIAVPGSEFEYQSGAPQLLGMVLTEATGMTVSDYASNTLWHELGATHDAYWHLDDKEGMELTYCCFNSDARNFARFGQMLLHHGRFGGRQLLDSAFVAKAVQPQKVPYYGWSFWLYNTGLNQVYYMRGILGQYVIVIPEEELVICRLGHALEKDPADQHAKNFKLIVEEVSKYF